MKNEAIWKNLTDIRDEYIEEASPDCANTANELKMPKKRLQKRIIGWGALAASLAIVATAAYPIIDRLSPSDTTIVDDAYANYPTRPMADYLHREDALWRVFTFHYEIDGKTEQMEFPPIEWEGETYALSQSNDAFVTVSEEQIGEQIGEVKAVAHTAFGDQSATLDATLYACEGIDPAYGMVVRFEGVEDACLYRSGKHADSLDELVEKANYRELSIVSPNVFHTTRNVKGEEIRLVFEGMTADILWDELLSYGETVDYNGDDGEFLRISIGHELLQYESVLCVSADGYITFGGLTAGKAVRVGKERARAFLDYIEDNLDGYRLVEEEAASPSENETPNTVTVTSTAKPGNPAKPE